MAIKRRIQRRATPSTFVGRFQSRRRDTIGTFERALRFESLEDRRLLATITVNTLFDEADGSITDGDISLRDAIAAAAPNDTIAFSVKGTINLSVGTTNSNRQLTIGKNLSIVGPGADLLTIKAFDPDAAGTKDGDGSRAFNVDDGTSAARTVSISGLTITGGDIVGNGGGLRNVENLTLSDCTVTGNLGQAAGGGLYNGGSTSSMALNRVLVTNNTGVYGGGVFNVYGTLTITTSTISGNGVFGNGGGVQNNYGVVNIVNSTISGNNGGGAGGGILTGSQSPSGVSTLTLTGSTVSGNTAIAGGGIWSRGTDVTLNSSTISGNSATGAGGGFYMSGHSLAVHNSTITLNQSGSNGGGMFVSTTPTTLDSTIVAGNTIGSSTRSDISGAVTSRYSLIGDNTGITSFVDQGGNQVGTSATPINPSLEPLADNGGPTKTHELFGFSPAVGAGDPAAVPGVGGVPISDQRGAPFVRKVNSRIDIGAYELQNFGVPINRVVDTLADESDGNYSAGDLSLREAIGLANGNVTFNETITFAPGLQGKILLKLGELAINEALTITGPGASLLTIDASGNDPTPTTHNGDGSRIFFIYDGYDPTFFNVKISGLTLTGGDVSGLGQSGFGGAIRDRENLTISSSVITGNYADGGGGVSHYLGTLLIDNSTISNNVARLHGGGGVGLSSGSVVYSTITNTSFIGNSAATDGGGIYDAARLQLVDSTVSGNTAGDGGGIFASNTVIDILRGTIAGNTAATTGGGVDSDTTTTLLENVTISGNAAQNGGGAYFIGYPTATSILVNSTVSDNTASKNGGGINLFNSLLKISSSTITGNRADADSNGSGAGGGTYLVGQAPFQNSILAGNLRGVSTRDDAAGADHSVAAMNSLIGDSTGFAIEDDGGNLIGTATSPINPLLGPLADNGGTTKTRAPLAGSPAINAGNASAVAGTGGIGQYDQRGAPFTRVASGRIDMGAVEVQTVPRSAFGDFTGNGVVNASDYVVWRNTLGNTVVPSTGADGDGNGIIDQNDYAYWRSHFGQNVPAGFGSGSDESGIAAAASSIGRDERTLLEPSKKVSVGSTATAPLSFELVGGSGEIKRAVRAASVALSTLGASRDEALLSWLASPSGSMHHPSEEWQDAAADALLAGNAPASLKLSDEVLESLAAQAV